MALPEVTGAALEYLLPATAKGATLQFTPVAPMVMRADLQLASVGLATLELAGLPAGAAVTSVAIRNASTGLQQDLGNLSFPAAHIYAGPGTFADAWQLVFAAAYTLAGLSLTRTVTLPLVITQAS